MRLESLDITNFRIIRRATIEFPDSVIGIIGPNGSGKSSIVEAIAWALYGTQAARSGRDEVKSTFARAVDTCEVNLAFVIGSEHYRIVRRLASGGMGAVYLAEQERPVRRRVALKLIREGRAANRAKAQA